VDNRQRTINYLRQNRTWPVTEAPTNSSEKVRDIPTRLVDVAPAEYVALLLKPGQIKRVQKCRGGEGGHRQRQRARRELLLERRISHWTAVQQLVKHPGEQQG
jgi:hypothetical protein